MDEWNFIADRKIQKAMEDGEFDRLEGTGKPLDLRENPFEDPSLRMAHRILRNNGFAPAWIEESKEIEAELRRLDADGPLPPEDLRKRVDTLNRRILAFNLKAPHRSLHKPLIKCES